jgi:hypothetical protein
MPPKEVIQRKIVQQSSETLVLEGEKQAGFLHWIRVMAILFLMLTGGILILVGLLDGGIMFALYGLPFVVAALLLGKGMTGVVGTGEYLVFDNSEKTLFVATSLQGELQQQQQICRFDEIECIEINERIHISGARYGGQHYWRLFLYFGDSREPYPIVQSLYMEPMTKIAEQLSQLLDKQCIKSATKSGKGTPGELQNQRQVVA